VVAVPCGLTVPATVAVVGATAVTGPVEAVGAVAAAADPANARAETPRTARSPVHRVLIPVSPTRRRVKPCSGQVKCT
jgi:hypothetical protein